MTRLLLRCAILAGLVSSHAVHADCPDWSSGQVRERLVQDLPGAPDITLAIASQPAGFSYHRIALAARWIDASSRAPVHQMLLEDMGLAAHPDVRIANGHLIVQRDLCGWQAPCRRQTLRFAYDAHTRRFQALPAELDDWLFDPDDDRWYRQPPEADEAGLDPPQPQCPAEDLFRGAGVSR